MLAYRFSPCTPSMADCGGRISIVLQHGSNCSLSRSMDGQIMCHRIISSCQSAVTSEIVKHCWSWVSHVSSAIATTNWTFTFTFTFTSLFTFTSCVNDLQDSSGVWRSWPVDATGIETNIEYTLNLCSQI